MNLKSMRNQHEEIRKLQKPVFVKCLSIDLIRTCFAYLPERIPSAVVIHEEVTLLHVIVMCTVP